MSGRPILLEMLLPRRPVSDQTENRENRQAWKAYVYGRARTAWNHGLPLATGAYRLTLVYVCDDSPADVDNIIKPIQDGLEGVVFANDLLVADVDSHRRFLSDGIDVTNLPDLLFDGVVNGAECVYVAVSHSKPLEEYL